MNVENMALWFLIGALIIGSNDSLFNRNQQNAMETIVDMNAKKKLEEDESGETQ